MSDFVESFKLPSILKERESKNRNFGETRVIQSSLLLYNSDRKQKFKVLLMNHGYDGLNIRGWAAMTAYRVPSVKLNCLWPNSTFSRIVLTLKLLNFIVAEIWFTVG